MKNEFSILPLAHASKVLLLAAILSVGVCGLARAEETKPVPASQPVAAPAAKVAVTDAIKPAGKDGDASIIHMGKIAVVDVQYLVSNSAAGKSIRSQLEAQRNGYKGQIEKQEADLRSQEKKLAEKQATLSKDDFLVERKKFQQKVIEAQKSVQQRRITFDKAYADATDKLRDNIVKVVAELSAKRGVSLVMSRQDLVLVDQRLDMTAEVLKALDARVTSIPVNIK